MKLNLKQRFSLGFSLLFSLLLGTVLIVVFALFSRYRREEFSSRLSEKLETTVRLFVEVEEVDSNLLKIIERNTVHKFMNESIYIFDKNEKLLYTTTSITSTTDELAEELKELHPNAHLVKRKKNLDYYGIHYQASQDEFLAVIVAEDRYGNRKLNYLKYLLLGAFGAGVLSVWMVSIYLSKKSLEPLDDFRERIQNINDQNLNLRLPTSPRSDEIDELSIAFNLMMDRIDQAYSKQKEFTGNASHELRTPLSRITGMLANIQSNPELPESVGMGIKEINDEVYQMADIISSLMLLSKLNENKRMDQLPRIRMDELIFDCVNTLTMVYPDLKFHFDLDMSDEITNELEIAGDEGLIRIAIKNLIKNAYLYSDNHEVRCKITNGVNSLELAFINSGPNPEMNDLEDLFKTFSRGNNSSDLPGSGIGLSIVRRVIEYHFGFVTFTIPQPGINQVTVVFHTKLGD